MEKLKIAVCFSGQVRTWKHCYHNWEDNLASLGDVDYFCHFWDYNSIPLGAINGYDVVPDDTLLSEEEKQSIISALKPKRIEFESKKTWPNVDELDHWYSKRITTKLIPLFRNQFYSLIKVANLKRQYELENKFEYDVVIRMRPDSIFFTKPNIIKPAPNTIYTIHQSYSTNLNMFGIADVYYHCDSFTFDQISWFVNSTKSIDLLEMIDNNKLMFSPEYPFYYYIKSIGIDLKSAEVDPLVVVTPESRIRKGFLQANEILNTDV